MSPHLLICAICTLTYSRMAFRKPLGIGDSFFLDTFHKCDDLTKKEIDFVLWLFTVIDQSTFDVAQTELHFLYVSWERTLDTTRIVSAYQREAQTLRHGVKIFRV